MDLFGPPNIEHLKAKGDIPGLIKAMNYKKDSPDPKNTAVRRAAAQALGEIGDARAVEPLIAALSEEGLCQAAVEALGKIGDARAVEPLIGILDKISFSLESGAVARALGDIGDPRAVKALIAYIVARKYAYIEQIAAERQALVKIGTHSVDPFISALGDRNPDVVQVAVFVLEKIGSSAVGPLLSVLTGPDEKARQAAIEALGGVRDSRAVEPLIGVLQDGSQGERRRAAQTLGKIGDARCVEPLIAALHDGDLQVHLAAVESLGKLGDSRAVPPLIAELQDGNAQIRKAAVESLGNIRDDRAVEPLIVSLKDDRQEVRQAAVGALGRLGDSRAIEPFIAILKEDNEGMHDAVVAALVMIGSPAVEVLISMLQDGIEPQVMAEALGKIGAPRAVQPLIDYLEIDRKSAAFALVNIYQSGKLDDQNKQKILWSRNKISQNDHYDMVFKDCDLHSEHDDRGFAGININWSQ